MKNRAPLSSGLRWWSVAGLAAVLAATFGCAPRYLNRTPENAARYPYLAVEPQELANYKALLAINPGDPQAAKAEFWVAQDDYNRSEWTTAERGFLDACKRFPASEWAAPARLMAARTRVKLKQAAAALPLLRELVRPAANQPPEVREAAQSLAQDVINDELTLAELERVRATYPDTDWPSLALFVSGKRTLDAGKPDQATVLFKQFLELYPDSPNASLARDLIQKATGLVPLNRNRLGALLPMSGEFAPYGKVIAQGLELALSEINQRRAPSDKLALTVEDSEGTTANAAAGFQRLAEVEKIFAVLGPALSASVKALLPDLDRWRVPVITPSASDPELAGHSAYLFRYMLTNEQQGEAMAEFIVLRQGLRRIGILSSQERYDRSLAEAFANKVKQLGGEIVSRQEYAAGSTDFKEQMLALGGLDPGKLKDQELGERKKLDNLLDYAAHEAAMALAPEAQIKALTPVVQPTPEPPGRKVAIVRFLEQGSEAQKEQLGKKITERFSYVLAAKPGLEVLTQRKTFELLRRQELSPLDQAPAQWSAEGEALGVTALVLGSVTQAQETPVAVPGEPIPIRYTLLVRTVDPRSGKELASYTHEWVKTVPPENNTQSIDAIYLPVSLDDAVLIAPQLPFYDLQVAVFGPDAWISPRLLREGSGSLDGAVIAAGFWADDPDPEHQSFVRRYEQTYAEPPTSLAAQAYDALKLVVGTIDQLPRTAGREELAGKLHQIKDYQGLTGRAWVDANGDIRREPVFLKLENGQLKKVQ